MVAPDDARWGFIRAVCRPEKEIDLAEAALWLAAEDYPALVVQQYLARLHDLAEGAPPELLRNRLDPVGALEALSDYLFGTLGFRGNTADYYDPRNSYLNEVIDRRLGIPITLSLVYMEVARRLGIPIVGVGMPGHFIVRHRDVADLYVDPFNGGAILDESGCRARLSALAGRPVSLAPGHLAPVGPRAILVRLLTNLKVIYLQRAEWERCVTVIDRILTISPTQVTELVDRGVALYRLGLYDEAIDALAAYRRLAPAAGRADVDQRERAIWRALTQRN